MTAPSPAPRPSGQSSGAGGRQEISRLPDIERMERMERFPDAMLAFAKDYPREHVVPPHRHSRTQLLYCHSGAVLVTTSQGRWLVPPDHALWIPAGVEHQVATRGAVRMRSLYARPGEIANLPDHSRVVRLTDLMRSLILEAVDILPEDEDSRRFGLILALIGEEIPRLAEVPLGLAIPTEGRLAALCLAFLDDPGRPATIDDWAGQLAMSRRAFTRHFRRETGLSLSVWRQHARLIAAVPRLAAGEAVTTVALDLGYESIAAFTTMFRRVLGEPPGRYRGPPFRAAASSAARTMAR